MSNDGKTYCEGSDIYCYDTKCNIYGLGECFEGIDPEKGLTGAKGETLCICDEKASLNKEGACVPKCNSFTLECFELELNCNIDRQHCGKCEGEGSCKPGFKCVNENCIGISCSTNKDCNNSNIDVSIVGENFCKQGKCKKIICGGAIAEEYINYKCPENTSCNWTFNHQLRQYCD